MWSAQPSEEGTTAVLSFDEAFKFGLLVGVGLLLIGVLILVWRDRSPDKSGVSLVRSWVAIGLLFGLLMFCVLSFAMTDGGLRNTLVGGLTASVGAAIAFYFSSKSGEQARKDIMDVMDTALVKVNVPDLVGRTIAEASAAMARTSLKFDPEPDVPPADHVVVKQDPPPGASVATGVLVKAIFGQRP